MLFNKKKLLALFLVPKTGTTSACDFLKNCGWKNVLPEHRTPEYFLKRYPNLNLYNYFAYIRNPLNRFESTILYLKGLGRIDVTYEKFVDKFDYFYKQNTELLLSQTEWFKSPKVKALDFDNYETELRKLAGDVGSTYQIKKLNNTSLIEKDVMTQKVIDFVRSHYAEDYALAKERLGKEY